MNNPFQNNIPNDFSVRTQSMNTVNTSVATLIPNYPMAETALNNNSTYFQSGGNLTKWSLYRAISNVDINDFNIDNVTTINMKNTDNATLNTLEATTEDLYFNGNIIKTGDNVTSLNTLQNLVTISSTNNNLTINEVGNDIQLTVLSGGIGVESLDSLVGNIGLTSTGGTVAITTVGNDINLEANVNLGVSSLESLTGAIGLTSTDGTIAIKTVGNNINLETTGITPVTDWSLYPAIQNVNMANFNLTSSSTSGVIVDAGASLAIPTINLTSQNGAGGRINMTANGGVDGTSYGAIDITANGGTTAGLTAGGSINIISNTPVGTSGSFTGKVNINAAGINSYAGASSTLGSIAGYNFIHGDAAVNVTAGIPPIVPSDPLCVYLYGTNGTLMYGTQYMGRIRPYSDLTTNPTDLIIEKYNNLITTGYIVINGCKTLNLEPAATLSVSNGTGSNGQVLGKSGGNLAWLPATATGYASPRLSDVGNATWPFTIIGLLSTSIVLATITDVDDVANPQNCWLINAVPSTDTLTFNMSSPITTETTLNIAYHVTKF